MKTIEQKNYIFENDKSSLLITIIVAVLNGAKTLQHCIDSVANQTYANKELIIMDGESTDGTIEILKANKNKITYWESKSDKGIYHAWNKALKKATGEWVCFLGADDYWINELSLEKLIRCGRDFDLISGKVALIDSNEKFLRVVGKPWNWNHMKKWQCIAHSGMLHRQELFLQFGSFNEKYRIAGDYDFLLRLGSKVTTAFVDEVLVCVSSTGVSKTRVIEVLSETKKIQSHHPEIGALKALINYQWSVTKSVVRKLLCVP